MASIVTHIGDSQRCWVEGEAVLQAKHIVACGIMAKNDTELKIMALCAQTSCLRGKPHEIVMTVTCTGFKITCSCKAGQSQRCRHCVAVLLHSNRYINFIACNITLAWYPLGGCNTIEVYQFIVQ